MDRSYSVLPSVHPSVSSICLFGDATLWFCTLQSFIQMVLVLNIPLREESFVMEANEFLFQKMTSHYCVYYSSINKITEYLLMLRPILRTKWTKMSADANRIVQMMWRTERQGEGRGGWEGWNTHKPRFFFTILISTRIYSVSTNFCLELIGPYARQVENQQFSSS